MIEELQVTPELKDLIKKAMPRNFEEFKAELTGLINKYSMENGSDTPDFILADYLCACLLAFNQTSVVRAKWYGKEGL